MPSAQCRRDGSWKKAIGAEQHETPRLKTRLEWQSRAPRAARGTFDTRLPLPCVLRCHAPRHIGQKKWATGPGAQVVAVQPPPEGHSPEADRARFLSSTPRRRWRSRDGRPGRNSAHNRTQGTRSESRKARKACNATKSPSLRAEGDREPWGKRSPGFPKGARNRQNEEWGDAWLEWRALCGAM